MTPSPSLLQCSYYHPWTPGAFITHSRSKIERGDVESKAVDAMRLRVALKPSQPLIRFSIEDLILSSTTHPHAWRQPLINAPPSPKASPANYCARKTKQNALIPAVVSTGSPGYGQYDTHYLRQRH